MNHDLIGIVCALLVIAGATAIAPRLGIAAPLLLVGTGVVASLLPAFAEVRIDPEWILMGVLPPLLYSSAVSMPAMSFRRELGAISGLSLLLVVATSLALGGFFVLVLPDLGLAWGIALGAIISPTDAVATSIIKRTPVSKRVVTILDGESLLNDATALVVLRTAIAATAASFSLWDALTTFAFSVATAVGIGLLVGWLNLAIRQRVSDPTVNTIVSFTVPFLASVPADAVGASGLVAAVVAGVLTSVRAPRELSPQSRLSDEQNWRAVEFVLEGAVFLTMGLQIRSIAAGVGDDHGGLGPATMIAVGAVLITLAVRSAFVASLLGCLTRHMRRRERMRPRLADAQSAVAASDASVQPAFEGRVRNPRRLAKARDLERFSRRLTQSIADIDYFLREPLGWRAGTSVVWAGMRGAVTVAAAQTLPEGTPQRSLLVLVAYTVATLSLLIQGGTIGPLARVLANDSDREGTESHITAERARITRVLAAAESQVLATSPRDMPAQPGRPLSQRIEVLRAQRSALLDERDKGVVDADLLTQALVGVDSAQIAAQNDPTR